MTGWQVAALILLLALALWWGTRERRHDLW
jgi:hypothetical protein